MTEISFTPTPSERAWLDGASLWRDLLREDLQRGAARGGPGYPLAGGLEARARWREATGTAEELLRQRAGTRREPRRSELLAARPWLPAAAALTDEQLLAAYRTDAASVLPRGEAGE